MNSNKVKIKIPVARIKSILKEIAKEHAKLTNSTPVRFAGNVPDVISNLLYFYIEDLYTAALRVTKIAKRVTMHKDDVEIAASSSKKTE